MEKGLSVFFSFPFFFFFLLINGLHHIEPRDAEVDGMFTKILQIRKHKTPQMQPDVLNYVWRIVCGLQTFLTQTPPSLKDLNASVLEIAGLCPGGLEKEK